MISVIIIFLNTDRFIDEAIGSVLAQTYNDWELLLIDDGSSDGGTAIAQRYAQDYPAQIRYQAHPGHANRGMSASRNLGIQLARGQYITFLDADDILVPHALAEQHAILEAHPDAAMIYGPIKWWYSWTNRPEDEGRDYVEQLGVQPDSLIQPPMLLSRFVQDKAAVPSGIMVRRDLFERIGAFEDSFRNFYEDQVFCAKVCLYGPVFAASACWYWYRQHAEATCIAGQQTGGYYTARPKFLLWLEGYLRRHGVNDAELHRVIEKELWPYRHPLAHWLGGQVHQTQQLIKSIPLAALRRGLPAPARRRLGEVWQIYRSIPPTGRVRWGSLRRVTPMSRNWGYERGTPIDRYYIERFLAAHADDIRGRVLEIAENTYTCQFGGARVTQSDVLHVVAGDPRATLIGDLADGDHLPADTFDCVILTQTLQLIYDIRAALRTIYRILKPGGVLLLTIPGISQISRYDMDRWGDYWRFTSKSARRVFGEIFPVEQVYVSSTGNVLAATAFLQGLASQDLRQDELDYPDPDYEFVLTIRAAKPIQQANRPQRDQVKQL